MKISIQWILALALSIVFITLVQMIQKKSNQEKELWTQFECGFNVMNPSHIPFSFQFFLISLLFLIFDVEIALVLSYPMEPQSMKNLTMMMTFVMFLSIGLLYEWQKSKIKWSE